MIARSLWCVLPLLVALATLSAFAPTEPPPPLVIRAHVPKDQQVCAEYISDAFPRDVQRSCVEAARVKEWLLMNGRPTGECDTR